MAPTVTLLKIKLLRCTIYRTSKWYISGKKKIALKWFKIDLKRAVFNSKWYRWLQQKLSQFLIKIWPKMIFLAILFLLFLYYLLELLSIQIFGYPKSISIRNSKPYYSGNPDIWIIRIRGSEFGSGSKT